MRLALEPWIASPRWMYPNPVAARVGNHAEGDEASRLRESGRFADRQLEALDVGNEMIGGEHDDGGIGVEP